MFDYERAKHDVGTLTLEDAKRLYQEATRRSDGDTMAQAYDRILQASTPGVFHRLRHMARVKTARETEEN